MAIQKFYKLVAVFAVLLFVSSKLADNQMESFDEMKDRQFEYMDDNAEDDGYYKTDDGLEKVFELNRLNREQKLVKEASQRDTNFNIDANYTLPYGMPTKAQGWWADVVNNENSSSSFYSKPKEEWIWPY